MSESLVIAISGIAGALLSGIISFILGRRAERQKQTLWIRAEMLKPIDGWLKGVEKMAGIFSDTISSIVLNSPLPLLVRSFFDG
jgi:membrane protein DedA with SNARE-associated domain